MTSTAPTDPSTTPSAPQAPPTAIQSPTASTAAVSVTPAPPFVTQAPNAGTAALSATPVPSAVTQAPNATAAAVPSTPVTPASVTQAPSAATSATSSTTAPFATKTKPPPTTAGPKPTTAQLPSAQAYQQTRDALHKTKEMAREIHDNLHQSCHNRVAAKLAAAKIHAPTADDVLRYRYHHGVNLGSCFVLERWLTPSIYPQGADTSELAAVSASVNQFGVSETRQKWEAHWANMVTDADFDWLVNVAHCTSIRLPLGYWVLGATCTKGTPFQPFSAIYAKAWSAVKKLVSRARARGIGTLIDLHALPGGANGGDHSGTNTGIAELWTNPDNLDLATHCVLLLAQEINRIEGVVGLQICNEALFQAPNVYEWYDQTLGAVALIDPKVPIYISDVWDLPTAVRYSKGKNTVPSVTLATSSTNPIVIDTHCYWTFSDADKAKTPYQIISEVPARLSETQGKDGNVVETGALQVIVGQYCCSLDEQTWSKAPVSERQQLATQFGQAQSKTWQQHSAGAYFWTFKLETGSGEFSFVQQTKTTAVTAPPNLLLPSSDVQSRIGKASNSRLAKRKAAVDAHVGYWSKREPQKTFEHWRHETGWDVGFADAMAFFGMRSCGGFDQAGKKGAAGSGGGDKIGAPDLWVRQRILDAGMAGPYLWEFETGLRQGIQDFYACAGV